MKIVLDFDDTIFNTHQFFHSLSKIFQKVGFAENEFWNGFRETKIKIGHFDSKIILEILYRVKHFDKKKIKREMSFFINKADKFIYSDFIGFAGSFDKKDLILLSFGITDFQKEKIENSKIIPLLNEIIITKNNKVDDFKNITQKYSDEKIFFIDDEADQIDQVKKEFPEVIALKMERPQGRHTGTKSELADYIVKDLYETREIIQSNLL